jgi:AraC-like DNA-binding protein
LGFIILGVPNVRLPPSAPPLVAQTIELLRAHYAAVPVYQGGLGRNLGIEEVAAVLATSRSSLQRAFRQSRTSFTAERLGVRMRLAMEDALTRPDWFPKGFCGRYGYGDGEWPDYARERRYQPESASSRFSKAFYAYWGISVVEVRVVQQLRAWLWTVETAQSRRAWPSLTTARVADARLRIAALTSAVSYTGTPLDEVVARLSGGDVHPETEDYWRQQCEVYEWAGRGRRWKYPPIGRREFHRLRQQGLTNRLAAQVTEPSRREAVREEVP